MAKKSQDEQSRPNASENMHNFFLAIPKGMWSDLTKAANRLGLPYSAIIRMAISQYLKEQNKD